MKINGYSERGILNALFYEIQYNSNADRVLNDLLELTRFPFSMHTLKITNPELLIEQSFSDFGDADAVIFCKDQEKKTTIFIEAKVKTFHKKVWDIEKEFMKFQEGITDKVSTSNLFNQLYLKYKLSKNIKDEAKLQGGVAFPDFSRKLIRKIGKNDIVLDAIKLVEKYSDKYYFIGIIPGDIKTLSSEVINHIFKILSQTKGIDWSPTNLGFISWEQVMNFCETNSLTNTLNVFNFNRSQIY